LEGKSVSVLRQQKKDGRLYLLLAPPSADPILIPADWTDFSNRELPADPENHAVSPANPSCALGSITDLLRMRTVIDGLLRSLSATAPDNQQRLDSEGTGATVPELPDPVSTRNTAQPTRANATRRSCPHPRRDHHQGGQPSRAADRQGDRNDKSNRGGPA
ncbi:MAG: hypothetical protein QOD93_2278, partial [Acetobacteraceae bacterium]|nr:hypothetical protein [Acetobacteraceae bacterium]